MLEATAQANTQAAMDEALLLQVYKAKAEIEQIQELSESQAALVQRTSQERNKLASRSKRLQTELAEARREIEAVAAKLNKLEESWVRPEAHSGTVQALADATEQLRGSREDAKRKAELIAQLKSRREQV